MLMMNMMMRVLLKPRSSQIVSPFRNEDIDFSGAILEVIKGLLLHSKSVIKAPNGDTCHTLMQFGFSRNHPGIDVNWVHERWV